jgi:hypothetical protein
MGPQWVERHSTVWVTHVLGLVGNARAAPSHVDAVYARKCVLFVLHALVAGMMSEKAQIAAAKDMCAIIARHMNALGKLHFQAIEHFDHHPWLLWHHSILCYENILRM